MRDVIVVDDLDPILDLFPLVADRYGIEDVRVRTFNDPRDALAEISRGRFDAVVTDLQMPHVNGIEVLTAARAARPEAYCALMTGYLELPTDAARIHDLRVDAYLQKPARAQEIADLLYAFSPKGSAELARFRAAARERERSP